MRGSRDCPPHTAFATMASFEFLNGTSIIDALDATTDNERCICLAGAAGSGKSYALGHYFKPYHREGTRGGGVIVTGAVDAIISHLTDNLRCNGCCVELSLNLYKLLKIRVDQTDSAYSSAAIAQYSFKTMQRAPGTTLLNTPSRTIIIEEAALMHGRLMMILVEVLKLMEGHGMIPHRVIMTADPIQLAPAENKYSRMQYGPGSIDWFFRHKSIMGFLRPLIIVADPNINYRIQRGPDGEMPHLFDLLTRMRQGKPITDGDVHLLTSLSGKGQVDTCLVSHKEQARKINESEEAKLHGKRYYSKRTVRGNPPDFDGSSIPPILSLCAGTGNKEDAPAHRGTRVIFKHNARSDCPIQYRKGMAGYVVNIDTDTPPLQMYAEDNVTVIPYEEMTPQDRKICYTFKATEIRVTIKLDKPIGDEDTIVVGAVNHNLDRVSSIRQLPIALAYAINYHAIQGYTLQGPTRVDFSQAWEKGMVYMALSRFRRNKDIVFKSTDPKADPVNRNFLVGSRYNIDRHALDFYQGIIHYRDYMALLSGGLSAKGHITGDPPRYPVRRIGGGRRGASGHFISEPPLTRGVSSMVGISGTGILSMVRLDEIMRAQAKHHRIFRNVKNFFFLESLVQSLSPPPTLRGGGGSGRGGEMHTVHTVLCH